MRELFEILTCEEKSLELPWWMYAFVMPAALIAICLLAGV
jgi:hypothetical protein